MTDEAISPLRRRMIEDMIPQIASKTPQGLPRTLNGERCDRRCGDRRG
jgi:hypothetical protein